MALDYKTIVLKHGDCEECAGCGYLDDGELQPFKYWADLPVQSSYALQKGWVKPIECPECGGTGSAKAA